MRIFATGQQAAMAAFTMAFFVGLPVLAQAPIRVNIPGSAFKVEGRGGDVAIDDTAGGRRFRGKAFARLILLANVRLPPGSSADSRMQRLVVHFRTSSLGPSLRSVALRNGSN